MLLWYLFYFSFYTFDFLWTTEIVWFSVTASLPKNTDLRKGELFFLHCALLLQSITRFHFTLLLFHLQASLIFHPINFVLSTVPDKIQVWMCSFSCCWLWHSLLISIISSSPIFLNSSALFPFVLNLLEGYWDSMGVVFLSSVFIFFFLKPLYSYWFVYVFTPILFF